jgi:hypothetical protein
LSTPSFSRFEIDIAKGDRFRGTVLAERWDHAFGASTDTDTGEVDTLAWREIACCVGFTECKVGRQDCDARDCRGSLIDEFTTG